MSPAPEVSAIDISSEEPDEPLGYQHFLYNVNVEYSPGGSRSHSAGSRHSFKLKCLPYMVNRTLSGIDHSHKDSVASSSECSIYEDESFQSLPEQRYNVVDVAQATCAFLSNSDYVPNNNFSRRRVVLELISAKLSQSTTFNVPVNTSFTSILEYPNGNEVSAMRHVDDTTSYSPSSKYHHDHNTTTTPATSPSPTTSKRFVNYTLLIKTAPGLDNHPAVIERRFSDFLLLYQGLKSNSSYSKIVDKHVTFPKKVYVGNFTLANIAERSIEFTKLLNLCMTDINFLWSSSFISFLLDKELREAHRLSLCGDPDDVQALVETAYHIEQKLYLDMTQSLINSSNSSISLDNYACDMTRGRYSPTPPNGGTQIVNSPSNDTISDTNHHNHQSGNNYPESSPNLSSCGVSEDTDSYSAIKGTKNFTALNQRLLVTFCMLFLTYTRGERYPELKLAVQEFSQLISSQGYIDSMVNTRHHLTLRACLLFLMNINQGDIIDDERRLWLKRKLEDIDGSIAELWDNNMSSNSIPDQISNGDTSFAGSPRNKKCNGNSDQKNPSTSTHRVTKGDLTSLLRDRNFCSFQENKYIR